MEKGAHNWYRQHVKSNFFTDKTRKSALGAAVELLFSLPPVCHSLPPVCHCIFQLDFSEIHISYLFYSLPPICHCIFQLEFSEIHICSAPSNCMHLLSNCMHLPSLPSHRIGNTIWHELLAIFGDTCQLRVSSLQSLVFWRGSPFISWLCAQKIANAWDSLTCNVA